MNNYQIKLGASYKTGKQVTCKDKDCDAVFIKVTPNHEYCKSCAADRQRERSIASRKPKKKL